MNQPGGNNPSQGVVE